MQIFISSPGDVRPERHRAEQVIERLARQFAEVLPVETVLWEREPLTAAEPFQASISRPSQADVVVVILWSRLGTPLPVDEFPGPITQGQVTGTEWEFEDAMRASRDTGTPELLAYLKQAPITADIRDPDAVEAQLADKRRLDAFVERWFEDKAHGTFKGAHRTFEDTSEFEEMLERHLEACLQAAAQRRRAPDGGPPRSTWHSGSPFRGLEAFDVEHAGVFFGRTRARNELREALVAQDAAGAAFVTVVGPSGSGKSSLVRAGLIPDLRLPGMVAGVGETRFAIVRPRDSGGSPLQALATALPAESALPELAASGYVPSELHALLADAPQHIVLPVREALRGAALAAGLPAGARVLLVLVLDQLEELFTLPIEPAERSRLVEALVAFARSGNVWVVATLRSDFIAQLDELAELAALARPAGTFMLAPPNGEELGQIITRPARAAGLTYEIDPDTGFRLDEELRRAAGEQPGTLPLLEYVLERLWHERTPDKLLTFAAYRALGGLEGALGGRAEEVFAALPAEVRDAFPTVLRRLVTVGQREQAAATSRTVERSSFGSGTAERALVEALLAPGARLLVVDGDEVRIAHEALLAHWPRAVRQINDDRRDLRTRARLEHEAAEWRSAPPADAPGLLLATGIRLSEAEDLLRRRRPEVDSGVAAFVEASSAAAQQRRERELEDERRRRIEAEYRERQTLAAERRAAAERSYARAERNRARATVVELQSRRPDKEAYAADLRWRATEFTTLADGLWKEAFELDSQLADPPASMIAQPVAPRAGTMLSLEVGTTGRGECLVVRYGLRRDPRFVIVDGGSASSYQWGLRARLEALRKRWAPDGPLPVELVIVTHYDEDRIGGIQRFLRETAETLAAGQRPLARVKAIWFNNFLPIGDEARDARSHGWKDDVAVLAERCGIRVNDPFDDFVMPSQLGPARVMLDGFLWVTVLAPDAQWLRRWYGEWRRDSDKRGTTATDIVEQTELPRAQIELEAVEALSEGFSSPRIELLRAPPQTTSVAAPKRADASPVNLTSIVTLLEFEGRRLLLTGDARCDHIAAGLSRAGLLPGGGPFHVDVLQLPHWGSDRNVTAEFLRAVTADHYVVVANKRYRLPSEATLKMLAAARGEEAFTTHIADEDGGLVVVDLLKPRRRARRT